MGFFVDYVLMEFEYIVNGKIEYVGVDIDLVKKIVKDNNLKLKIVNMLFDSLLGVFKIGKIDIIIFGMILMFECKK